MKKTNYNLENEKRMEVQEKVVIKRKFVKVHLNMSKNLKNQFKNYRLHTLKMFFGKIWIIT